MLKDIEVGDVVRLAINCPPKTYNNVGYHDTYEVGEILDDKMTLLKSDGSQVSHNKENLFSYHVKDFVVAESVVPRYKSPIGEKVITEKFIRPGSYGKVTVFSPLDKTIAVRINAGSEFTADELRNAGRLFLDLADFLEGK